MAVIGKLVYILNTKTVQYAEINKTIRKIIKENKIKNQKIKIETYRQ